MERLQGSRAALSEALAGNQQLLRQITRLMDAAAALQRQLDEQGAEVARLRRESATAAATADGPPRSLEQQASSAGGAGAVAPIWDVEAAASGGDVACGSADGGQGGAAAALARDLSMRAREVEQLTSALGETHGELAAAKRVRLFVAGDLVCVERVGRGPLPHHRLF